MYRLHVDCDTCGSYEIKGNAWEYLKYLNQSERDFVLLPYLSAHLRQATDAGELILLMTENWRELAQGHAETPVAEKLRKILEHVAKRTSIGGLLYLENPARLSAAADVRDLTELKFVLSHLNDRNLIRYQPVPPPPERCHPDGSYDKTEEAIQLTVDGWAAVAPITGGLSAPASSRCRFTRASTPHIERASCLLSNPIAATAPSAWIGCLTTRASPTASSPGSVRRNSSSQTLPCNGKACTTKPALPRDSGERSSGHVRRAISISSTSTRDNSTI
jgi:hypothetical protein